MGEAMDQSPNAKLERFITEMPLPWREKQLALRGARTATAEGAAMMLEHFQKAASMLRDLMQNDH